MNDSKTHVPTFLAISAWLTGFEQVELQGTGMVDTYYQTVIAKNGAADVDYFFAEATAILAETAGDEAQTLAQIKSRLIPDS